MNAEVEAHYEAALLHLHQMVECARIAHPVGSTVSYHYGEGLRQAKVLEHLAPAGIHTPRLRVEGVTGRRYYVYLTNLA